MSNDPHAPAPAAPPIRSWSDAYAAIRRRASETRGWIELDSNVPNRRWPRTTGLDVIAIAAVVDAAFRDVDQSRHAGIVRRWSACKDALEFNALPALADTYRGNRSFWTCLAATCAHLSQIDCPLPPQAAWNALLAQLEAVRNASMWMITKYQPPILFPAASLDKLYLAQRDYLGKLRGADRLAPEPGMTGGVMPVPRSTNAEVIQLADFWSKALRNEKAKNANGYATVLARWTAVIEDIDKVARGAEPNAVYPHNHALWRAISSVSIHVAAAIQYGVSDAELWMAAIGERLDRVPEAAKKVARAIAEGASGAAHAVGRVANEAARGLFSGAATPLLIGGGVVAAFLLLRGRGGRGREERSGS